MSFHIYDEYVLKDSYSWEYDYKDVEIQKLKVRPGFTCNQMKSKASHGRDPRTTQAHNLDMYELNKSSYQINPDKMNEKANEKLKYQLFKDKFSFLIEIEKSEDESNVSFNLYTVITDFYLRLSDKEEFK